MSGSWGVIKEKLRTESTFPSDVTCVFNAMIEANQWKKEMPVSDGPQGWNQMAQGCMKVFGSETATQTLYRGKKCWGKPCNTTQESHWGP